MEILTKTELQLRYDEIIEKINHGAVFIYPTDTIYGIGCSALNQGSIDKIRRLKERPDSPFSVWIPSLRWITENCNIKSEDKEWLKQLPGPFTLIIKLKNKNSIAENVSFSSTVGVRVPNHWFHQVVEDLNAPILTTSANRAGHPFMTSIEDLDEEIKLGVDFIIYEGPKEGKPSKLVNLVEGKVKER